MVTFYGSSLLDASVPAGQELAIRGASRPGLVTKNGLVIFGNDGKMVSAPSDKHEYGWNKLAGSAGSVELSDCTNPAASGS